MKKTELPPAVPIFKSQRFKMGFFFFVQICTFGIDVTQSHDGVVTPVALQRHNTAGLVCNMAAQSVPLVTPGPCVYQQLKAGQSLPPSLQTSGILVMWQP